MVGGGREDYLEKSRHAPGARVRERGAMNAGTFSRGTNLTTWTCPYDKAGDARKRQMQSLKYLNNAVFVMLLK